MYRIQFIFFCFFSSCLVSLCFAQDYLKWAYYDLMPLEEIETKMTERFDEIGRTKGTGYNPYQRWLYWARRSVDEQGRVLPDHIAWKRALQFQAQSPGMRNNFQEFIEMGPKAAVNTSTWSSALGRLSGLSVEEGRHEHILVSSPGGGVWKTLDHGATWESLFDYQTIMEVYVAEISPHDNQQYLVGTFGQGIFKSEDQGATWIPSSGESQAGRYNRILYHATDPNIVWAINEFEGDIYRSEDAGDSWTIVYNGTRNLYDLEIKPDDPMVVYASGNSIVLKSEDGGLTFTEQTGPWSGTSNAIMLAVTPAASGVVYALEEEGGGMQAVHRSLNSMGSWTSRIVYNGTNNYMGYNQNQQTGQGPRDQDIIVSPDDINEVHVAGVETWKSVNGALSFFKTTDWQLSSSLPFIHADIDLLKYYGDTIFAATDGGIYYSTDGAQSFVDITPGIGVRQFYRIGVSATDSNRVVGGSQDNGSGVYIDGIWYDWLGADGMEAFIDWNNPNTIYGTNQYGYLYKSLDAGFTEFSLPSPENLGNWITPFEQDPCSSQTIYSAYGDLYKSINGGLSWNPISSFSGNDLIDELKIAPSNCDFIYLARQDKLYKSENGGSTWSDISPPGFVFCNFISIHPSDEERLVVALAGNNIKYMESRDAGSTWVDISYNLPDITAECAVYREGTNAGIYVGMRPGMYYLGESDSNWVSASLNMPNVQVTEIEIQHDIMYASTYGRGLWKRNLSTPLPNEGSICFAAKNLIPSVCEPQMTIQVPTLSSGNGASQSDAQHAYWYKYTPSFSGSFTISSCSDEIDTRLFLHKGSCDSGSLSLIASSDNACDLGSTLTVDLLAGEVLHIEWDDGNTASGFEFEISYDSNISNYLCDNSRILRQSGIYSSPGPSDCFGSVQNNATHANWYEVIPYGDGTMSIYSCLAGVDTRLTVHTGECGNLQQLSQNDDACALTDDPGSQLWASTLEDIPVSQGVSYFIEWDNRWSSQGFDFELVLDVVIPCATASEDYTSDGLGVLTDEIGTAIFSTDGEIHSLQTIQSDGDVIYNAAEGVLLLEDFEVLLGGKLETRSDGCD